MGPNKQCILLRKSIFDAYIKFTTNKRTHHCLNGINAQLFPFYSICSERIFMTFFLHRFAPYKLLFCQGLNSIFLSHVQSFIFDRGFYLSRGLIFLFNAKNSLNCTGLNTLSTLIGYFSNLECGRVGLFSKPPPQLGQTFSKMFSTHWIQNVHSKVQIMASLESFGNILPQFSQLCLSSSI